MREARVLALALHLVYWDLAYGEWSSRMVPTVMKSNQDTTQSTEKNPHILQSFMTYNGAPTRPLAKLAHTLSNGRLHQKPH